MSAYFGFSVPVTRLVSYLNIGYSWHFVMYEVLTLNTSFLVYEFIMVYSSMRVYDRLSLNIGSERQTPSSQITGAHRHYSRSNKELLFKPRMNRSFRRRSSSSRDIHNLSLEDAAHTAHDDNLEQEERLRAETSTLAQARRRWRSRARQNIQNLFPVNLIFEHH